jgi:serine/threonine protein kinase
VASAHPVGIVHRDLKPANILLERRGVRLADFGIVGVAGEPSVTTTGQLSLWQRLLQRRRFWAVVLLAALIIGIAAGSMLA